MPASPLAPLIGIIMGSKSDWPTLKHAAHVLEELGIRHEIRIISAHRTPDRLYQYAKAAKARGLKAIIAGAGGAAHLPGMTAAMTVLPVLGVPVESRSLKGLDSLLSIAQMPGGVPVATFAIGEAGAKNAGLFAAALIAVENRAVDRKLESWRARQTRSVARSPDKDPRRRRARP
jgi:5-(carboxyamino)imidazole ribonucleotide mutase